MTTTLNFAVVGKDKDPRRNKPVRLHANHLTEL